MNFGRKGRKREENEIYLISFCAAFPVRIISFICAHPDGSNNEREISKRMDSERERILFFVLYDEKKLNASSLYYLL